MYLIYVNGVGKDWEGNYYYEFLFSEDIENVDGDNWDVYPANGQPEPPYQHHVNKVGKMSSNEIKLNLIQDSNTFAVWDAIDGVISLAWEDIDEYDEAPDVRLYFKYGENIEEVEEKLYDKGLIINYNKEGI